MAQTGPGDGRLGDDAGPLRRFLALLDRVPWRYVLITVVFLYTTVAIVVEKPDGIKIAGAFIASVIVVSMISRTRRSTELRFEKFDFVDETSRMLWDTLKFLEFPVLVPHRPGHQSIVAKDEQIRRVHRLGADEPIVFIEATLEDPSQFEHRPLMEVTQSEERFIIRLNRCASIAHAVATIALELSKTGKPPEVHFGWSDHSPAGRELELRHVRRRQCALAGPRTDHQGRARPRKDRALRCASGQCRRRRAVVMVTGTDSLCPLERSVSGTSGRRP